MKLGHGFKDHVGVLCRHVEEFTAAAVGVAGGVDGAQGGVDFGNHLVHHDVAELLVHPVCGVHPESKGHAGPVERFEPLLHIGGVADFDVLRESRVGEDVDVAVLAHDGVL